MYGYNIRYYGKPYPDKQSPYVDQLQNVINLLINDPNSRRILYTTYNPLNADQGVLYPCHGLIVQFYVTIVGNVRYVKLNVYQRSADILLGLPFNITSYAVLAYILCDHINAIISDKKESGSNNKSGDSVGAGSDVNSSVDSSTSGFYGNRSADCKYIDGNDKIIYKPDELIISLGDVHIYEEHLEAAKLQLTRQPFILPTLSIKPFKAIEELTYDHFILNNYVHHDAINAIMKS
jgi:thymidylate synthase